MTTSKSSDSAPERPPFSEAQAIALAQELYELDVTARELPADRDRNFRLTAVDGQDYVLKISSLAASFETLDCQHRALEHLRSNGLTDGLPAIVRDRQGREIATCTAGPGQAGNDYLVRLLTYVQGERLVDANPHTPELLRSLGQFVGRLDRAFEGFEHPGLHRDFKWHPRGAAAVVRTNLQFVTDDAKRALIERRADHHETYVVPLLAGLPTGAIHNDANDYNVLVGPPSPTQRVVTGIIDFGDMVIAHTVADLAVAAAYAMLDKPQPLHVAAQLVAGYHAARPLSPTELEVLFSLIAMRLCMSVTISAEQQRQEPDNTYLAVSERPAWDLLHRLEDVHPHFAEAVFREACGMTPCPRNAEVVSWLEEHGGEFGKIVDADLTQDPLTVFDLSVGSPLLATLIASRADTEALTDHLFTTLSNAGHPVGVGRYDEPRSLYTSDLFRTAPADVPGQGDGVQWRTIHLGMDLFMEPGATVYAPLAGTVHGFADNGMGLNYGPTILLAHDVGLSAPFYTLYGHLSRESLEGLTIGATIDKGQAFASLGEATVNGGWPPHLHFQIMVDDLGQTSEFPGVGSAEERAVWRSLCPDPNLILRIPRERFPGNDRSPREILGARRKHLGRSLSVSYDAPLKIVRGQGAYLYDDTGRRFLDCVNNVAHVGHAHPHVVAAARAQDTVLNTNTRYLHDNLVRYVERLQDTLPDPLQVVFLVCSGSEANDLAIRLARAHTARQDLVVIDGAYHGNLGSLIDISPYKFDGPGGSGMPAHVRTVATPDVFRGPFKGADAGARYAELLRPAIGGAAAFIGESLLGCGGQIVLPEGYLAAAFGHARDAGAVCIADEVQVGFGRVGTHFWGFETQGVIPDIVTLGKPIGNGHPMAAVVTTHEIAESFATGMEYFNTFGGNPVSCAVGLAVLDVIEREGLQEHARVVGSGLKQRLQALADSHPIIGDVRGLGLFIGVELIQDRATLEPAASVASYVVNRMQQHGILLSTDGPLHNVIKIKPPLVFSAEDASTLVDTLDRVLNEDYPRRTLSHDVER